jgi:hypothetical protein
VPELTRADGEDQRGPSPCRLRSKIDKVRAAAMPGGQTEPSGQGASLLQAYLDCHLVG